MASWPSISTVSPSSKGSVVVAVRSSSPRSGLPLQVHVGLSLSLQHQKRGRQAKAA
jgi:hypothetical protein